MAINFTCPRCGKRFEVSDALAGKKGRCSGCRNVLAIPDDGLEILPDLPEQGPRRTAAAGTGTIPRETIEVGSTIGSLTVEESSPTQLVLECTSRRLLTLVLSGAVALLGSLWGTAVLDAEVLNAQARGTPLRIPGIALIIPIAMLGYGGFTLCLIGRLGYRLTFDGEERSLGVRRFFVWEKTRPAEELGGVVFLVEEPNKHAEGHPECAQICEAYVIDDEGNPVALFERVEIKDPQHLVPLAEACVEAGHLLGLPVVADLRGEPRHEELRRALERIRKSKPGRPSRAVPAFRKPWVTTYKVAGAVGVLLVLAGIGRFLFKQTGAGGFLAQPAEVAAPVRPTFGAGANPRVAEVAPQPVGVDPQAVGADHQVERLIGDLRSPDERKRLGAAIQLSHREPGAAHRDAVRQALLPLVSSGDGMMQAHVLKALGRWGTDADVPLLIESLASPDPAVRDGAAEALSGRKDIRGAEAMAKLLHDPDRRFSMAIRLRAMGPPASPAVLPLLNDPDDEVKLEAARILESVGAHDDLPALRSTLDLYRGVASQVPRGGLVGPGARDFVSRVGFAQSMLGPLQNAIRNAAAR